MLCRVSVYLGDNFVDWQVRDIVEGTEHGTFVVSVVANYPWDIINSIQAGTIPITFNSFGCYLYHDEVRALEGFRQLDNTVYSPIVILYVADLLVFFVDQVSSGNFL